MNDRIKELAISDGIYDCLCDPYDKFKTGDYYGSVMWDLERFAEKIVRECMNVGNALAKETFSYSTQPGDIFEYKAHAMEDVVEAIKEHFGVKE